MILIAINIKFCASHAASIYEVLTIGYTVAISHTFVQNNVSIYINDRYILTCSYSSSRVMQV